jgi:hypothetical protein
MKKWYFNGMASLQGDNLIVFYYLSSCEILPDKRVVFGCENFNLLVRIKFFKLFYILYI